MRGTRESFKAAACYRFTILVSVRNISVAALVSLALAGPAYAAGGLVAIGDFGVGGERQRRTGAAVERFAADRNLDALVTLGDNDYTERPRAFRRNWRASLGWAAASGLVVAGSLGNHDVRVDGGRYQFDLLGMPRRFYERRFGDVGLFVLDSNRVGKPQIRWLERALERSDAPWKVVTLHHPPYSCGGYQGVGRIRRRLVPVFERTGVDLVLAAHDHNYQRFRRRGVTYVVHGGGGARLYPLRPCPSSFPRRRAAREIRGWLYVRVAADALVVRAIGLGGGTVDRVVLYP
ncbi:MAG: metallophosphoesterase family protein [Gaiellaceae bacterium]